MRWRTDLLGAPFESARIGAGSTLVRRLGGSERAVLYLHGYNDYFFQTGLAEFFVAGGYDFYALDLPGHGRSAAEERPITSLRAYFPELQAALDLLPADVLLVGQSTGALIGAWWAQEHPGRITRLIMISPNLVLPAAPWLRRLAERRPGLPLPIPLRPYNSRSLHRRYGGDWQFVEVWRRTRWRLPKIGWVVAVNDAQRALTGPTVPTLVLHSDRSSRRRRDLHAADAVLDVTAMRARARRLGPQVATIAIRGARHDILLSSPSVRGAAYDEITAWLAATAGHTRR
ncbi:MAG: alpha/beta hydrolase [Streptosporangiaceae bacterium]